MCAVGYVIKPLADTLVHIGAGGDVEQALIGFGVLHNGLGLALDREHYGPLAFLELLHSVVAAALITISGILPAAALIESLLVRLVVLWGLSTGALLAQSCPNVAATPSSDYGFLIGSAVSPVPAGSLYQWLVKGQPAASGHTTQLFLLHADGNAVSTEGIAPLAAKGVSFAPGRWGSALTVANGGALSYQRDRKSVV